jgi:hypothetical protein
VLLLLAVPEHTSEAVEDMSKLMLYSSSSFSTQLEAVVFLVLEWCQRRWRPHASETTHSSDGAAR